MSARRPVRINVALPELTPAQATFLWNFLDDLASDLWDAYEQDLLDVETEPSGPAELDNDWPGDHCDHAQPEPDPCTFHPWHRSGSCPTCASQINAAPRDPAGHKIEPDF